MNDMSGVIVPKSDQLNSDDLISGPITVKITGVAIRQGGEQPISIAFDGDNGKPYKPCKSMCRVMVTAWGADSKQYVGRSMTLYRDPSVRWGGMEVGGIRISHMSDIAAPLTMALTMTKQSRKPFTVKTLASGKESAGTQGKPSVSSPADESASPADLIDDKDEGALLDSLNAEPQIELSRFLRATKFPSLRAIPKDQLQRCQDWIARARTITKTGGAG